MDMARRTVLLAFGRCGIRLNRTDNGGGAFWEDF